MKIRTCLRGRGIPYQAMVTLACLRLRLPRLCGQGPTARPATVPVQGHRPAVTTRPFGTQKIHPENHKKKIDRSVLFLGLCRSAMPRAERRPGPVCSPADRTMQSLAYAHAWGTYMAN